jgi:D-serine deaminase-like pyridoxal phosphate-dependent protein
MSERSVPFPQEVLDEVPTPCLLVDVAAANRNIARAADYFSRRQVKLRPHFKAHKCTQLLKKQLEAGGCVGVTCATAAEAMVLADHGFTDVLVANQVVDSASLALVTRAAGKVEVSVAVDDPVQVSLLGTAAERNGVYLGVLIEVDVGLHRCGLVPNSPRLLRVAEMIERCPHLRLLGLQGYEGQVVLSPRRNEREAGVRQAAEILSAERSRLQTAGFPCPVVSGAGTGTFDLASDAGGVTEVQAGSYVLMDARYGSLDLPFENALYCCATVISRQGPGAGVLNAGLKALSAEYGMPLIRHPGAEVLKLSDEHAQVSFREPYGPGVGCQVVLVPAHIDPTINLHDVLFVWGEDTGLETWPVDGRRSLLNVNGH